MLEVQFRIDKDTTVSCQAQEGERLRDVAQRLGLNLGEGDPTQCRIEAKRERGEFPILVKSLSTPQERKKYKTARKNLVLTGMILSQNLDIIEVDMPAPSQEDVLPDRERLIRALKKFFNLNKVRFPSLVLRKLPQVLRENDFQVKCVVRTTCNEMFVYDVYGARERVNICALALDVGTTSVTGLLFNLENGTVLSRASMANGQLPYGINLTERIHAQEKPGGIQRLQEAIIEETLNPMIQALCESAGIPRSQIYRACIASNTCMSHLLMGIRASSLLEDPSIPAFLQSHSIFASDLGLCIHPDAYVMLSPHAGSQIGGDMTAATLVSCLWNRPEYSLLVDLGTSGKLVFGNEDFLLCCDCPTGPVFEGGEISCGMSWGAGAVEAVKLDWNSLAPTCRVAGGGKPLGLCGSGLIDLVSELLRVGVIDMKGKILRQGGRILRDEKEGMRYVLFFPQETANGKELSLSEEDIQRFIRAKAAVYAAIQTLISSQNFYPDMIDDVYLAGEMGQGSHAANAIRIGLLPDLPLEKFHCIGNASLMGAYMLLLSTQAEKKTCDLAQDLTCINLLKVPGYEKEYQAACFLPHTDTRFFPSLETR